MKKRKLRSYVLPTLYLLITISIFAGVVLLGRGINLVDKDYDYGIGAIEKDNEPVLGEEDESVSTIISPVESGKADIVVHFYSKDADREFQQNSLIYYENTYLPNTGVLYASDEEFSVNPTFNGKVTDILDDEFFGKCIVIEHSSHLRTYYYGLSNVEVKVGDEVTVDTIIGTSKNNEIMNDKKTFLLEVYHNNELINPESFIGTNITNYN